MTVSLARACCGVLLTAEPRAKVMAAREAARLWRRGALGHIFDVAMPDRPARPEAPELLPPNRMPKRGRAGSGRSRIALLHALAHIEFGAIDLAFDMAGRFGAAFPRGFIDDWLSVGADEALHFALLDRRLRALGRITAPCRHMTGCGRRRRKRRMMPAPGWRSCRWCWRRAGST